MFNIIIDDFNKNYTAERIRSSVGRLVENNKFSARGSTIVNLAERAKENLEVKIRWNSMEEAESSHSVLSKNLLNSNFGAKEYTKNTLAVHFEGKGKESIVLISGKKTSTFGPIEGCVAKTLIEGEVAVITPDFILGAFITQALYKQCVVAGIPENLRVAAKLYPSALIVLDRKSSKEVVDIATECHSLYGNEIRFIPSEKKELTKLGRSLSPLLGFKEHSPVSKYLADALLDGKEVKWIVHGFIKAGSNSSMFYAPSGEGKTFVVLDMMLKIALGFSDWFGYNINRSRVLYLAGEGYEEILERTKLFLQVNGYEVSSIGDWFAISPVRFKMRDNKCAEDFIQTVKVDLYGKKPDIIVLDTLSLYFEGDENKTADARNFNDVVFTLQNTFNCCVILVHHTAKANKDEARGNGAFPGEATTTMKIQRTGNIITVTQTKNRAMKPVDPVNIMLEEHEIEGTFDPNTKAPKKNSILVKCTKSVEPVAVKKKKKDKNEETDKDFLLKALSQYGTYDKEKNTYSITKDKLVEYGIEFYKKEKRTVQIMMNPNQKDKVVWKLINAGTLLEEPEGSFVLNDSAMVEKIKPNSF